MSNLIRRLLNSTKALANWKFIIKSNFNLEKIMNGNMDLKLEELRLQERAELLARTKLLATKQRCLESTLTDLTRSIKQMEFDIQQAAKENQIVSAAAATSTPPPAAAAAEKAADQQKIQQ
ncbi:uncharacterized protein LOC108595159 isoform X1 [Drosophila busckii]|uniref:uncharacterized protein LOC108595159 isoform X1 n=1 Tax=Drosophila busckii TaxID=30019 RepID=UPI00083EB162|nr:uncharacterized protein LOC108595159 isoform X1 [Drosophila busckii]